MSCTPAIPISAYRLCYRTVTDGDVAEDLVQEAFLRVIRFPHPVPWRCAFLDLALYDRSATSASTTSEEALAVSTRCCRRRDRKLIPTDCDETTMALDTSELSATKMAFDALNPEQKEAIGAESCRRYWLQGDRRRNWVFQRRCAVQGPNPPHTAQTQSRHRQAEGARDVNCEHAIELILDSLVEPLSAADQEALDRHLAECETCSGRVVRVSRAGAIA